MVWNANKTLNNGKYTIQGVLGQGGFGVTYFAIDNTNGNQVVIKTLNDFVQSHPDFAMFQQDFMNEALRLAKCNHAHIVKVYEVIQGDNLWCMVMEYAGKNDLGSLIHQMGALSETDALYYTHQIGEALDYIHSLNPPMIHRDVKPANILIRNNQGKPQAILIDFGIAREFKQNLTQSQTPILSDGFAPIEQYDKRAKRGAFTDVYALAATLYAMVTGEVPTAAPARMMFSLTPPKQINPQISDRLNQAILQGMELNPENRPQSIGEWLSSLGLTYQGKTVKIPDNGQNNWQNQGQKRQNIDLKSEVGINYSQLKNLLETGKWKEADIETYKLMLRVMSREKQGFLRDVDIDRFPCGDLQTINNLWVNYSNGRYGFSIQKQIYDQINIPGWSKKLGQLLGTIDNTIDNVKMQNFVPSVGWCKDSGLHYKYQELTFVPTAPKGHLPSRIYWQDGFFGNWAYLSLIKNISLRLNECNKLLCS
jgi:serine/threonine protein kinase